MDSTEFCKDDLNYLFERIWFELDSLTYKTERI